MAGGIREMAKRPARRRRRVVGVEGRDRQSAVRRAVEEPRWAGRWRTQGTVEISVGRGEAAR